MPLSFLGGVPGTSAGLFAARDFATTRLRVTSPFPFFQDSKVFLGRVGETSDTSGPGNFTPSGALTGARSFSSAVTAGQHFDYTIEGVTVPSEWEVGHGIWDGLGVNRAQVYISSNNNSLVNFSGGTKNIYITIAQSAPQKLAAYIYVKADYGAKGDYNPATNTGTDDTAAFTQAINDLDPTHSQVLVVEPGIYLIPNGITEAKGGIVVIGLGSRAIGPGVGSSVGAVIVATQPGRFVWDHRALNEINDYNGGRFENLTFKGNGVTAGALRLMSNYNIVQGCSSINNTTGNGFLTQSPPLGDDASWNIIHNCLSQDDLIGYQANVLADMTANPLRGASAEFTHCIANKTTAGGILNTGSGIRIYDNNSAIIGGKVENNSIGIDVLIPTASPGGTMIIGTRTEQNATYDISLNRPSGSNGTRNIVVCRSAATILVGAFQVNDLIIGGAATGAITDNGTDTVIIGNAIVKTTRTAGTLPTGGYSGEMRVGSGTIYSNNAGTWQAMQLQAAITKTGSYTITTENHCVAFDTTGGPVTATLPTAAGYGGIEFVVKDWKGTANTNNITVATTSSQTIDGVSTKTINTAFGLLRVISDGANWVVV